ncbi:uncharacterized protein LOC100642392 [Bombus terrestris]|uniref:Uncharacterized protein LOC100642392 n=1 Tax=Bombus terrestris TaxID=30195 RepID=A0A9B0F764_BOMTE|nr:uncharacterized protein LOC100642392 [Bombus terrestris]
MELWDFIRNIFGRRRSEKFDNGFDDYQNNYGGDNFQNSMSQIDIYDDSRSFEGIGHFNIFSDPLEITRYFESQIENIMMNFIYGFNNEGNDANTNVFSFIPSQRKSLRDNMLKPNNDQMELKLDTDLDGKLTIDNFSNVWGESDKPQLKLPRPSIIGRSIRKEYVRKPDGTIEQKQVIKDHEGNEETIISHQIGDKIHTIITKIDKNGVETKIEDISDISNCDLLEKRKLPNETDGFSNILFNSFFWEKLFKPNPKL